MILLYTRLEYVRQPAPTTMCDSSSLKDIFFLILLIHLMNVYKRKMTRCISWSTIQKPRLSLGHNYIIHRADNSLSPNPSLRHLPITILFLFPQTPSSLPFILDFLKESSYLHHKLSIRFRHWFGLAAHQPTSYASFNAISFQLT